MAEEQDQDPVGPLEPFALPPPARGLHSTTPTTPTTPTPTSGGITTTTTTPTGDAEEDFEEPGGDLTMLPLERVPSIRAGSGQDDDTAWEAAGAEGDGGGARGAGGDGDAADAACTDGGVVEIGPDDLSAFIAALATGETTVTTTTTTTAVPTKGSADEKATANTTTSCKCVNKDKDHVKDPPSREEQEAEWCDPAQAHLGAQRAEAEWNAHLPEFRAACEAYAKEIGASQDNPDPRMGAWIQKNHARLCCTLRHRNQIFAAN